MKGTFFGTGGDWVLESVDKGLRFLLREENGEEGMLGDKRRMDDKWVFLMDFLVREEIIAEEAMAVNVVGS